MHWRGKYSERGRETRRANTLCPFKPVSTFDPFKGVADLGTPMTFGAVSYVNPEE